MIILKKINLHDEQSQAVKGFQNERIICPLIQCYNRSPIKKKKEKDLFERKSEILAFLVLKFCIKRWSKKNWYCIMKFCWAWIKLKYKPSNESLFFGTSEAYHSTKPVCCSKWQASFSFWPSHIECLICYGYLKLSPCFYNFQECAFVILKAIIVIIFILTGQSSSGPWIQ